MIVAGVDPGLTGAIAFGRFRKTDDPDHSWQMCEILDVRDMPTQEIGGSRKPYARALFDLCQEFGVDLAVLEWPEGSAGAHGRGKDAMRAEFSFGAGCGTTLAALQLLSPDPCVMLAEPRIWKAALELGTDKQTSIDRASFLLDDRDYLLGKPKSHDRAEAVMLMRYLEMIVLPRQRLTLV